MACDGGIRTSDRYPLRGPTPSPVSVAARRVPPSDVPGDGTLPQNRLRIVPCSIERAKWYVETFHRHHGSSVQAKFCHAVIDEGAAVRGVSMVGRPVARLLDNGWTLEVNRLCTAGADNACSALYGAAARVAKHLGYLKVVTYIRSDEPGTSLRASGWTCEQEIRARTWTGMARVREDKTEVVRRQRWSITLADWLPCDVTWPEPVGGLIQESFPW